MRSRLGDFRAAGLVLLTAAGCGGNEVGVEAPPPIALAPPLREAPADKPLGQAEAVRAEGPREQSRRMVIDGAAFEVPAGWRERPVEQDKRAFGLQASFEIPVGEEIVTLTVSTVGGGLAANIERWKDQFGGSPEEPPRQETLLIDGRECLWVDLRGTYTAGFGAGDGPRENQRMLGVGIPRPGQEMYLKLIGPRPAVAEVEAEFRRMVMSARLGP